ncbi:MAG: hypothetical protein IKK66_10500 [Ruminococcus sp.]|nr:hypothetical protein [Ruminococcus sp.]
MKNKKLLWGIIFPVIAALVLIILYAVTTGGGKIPVYVIIPFVFAVFTSIKLAMPQDESEYVQRKYSQKLLDKLNVYNDDEVEQILADHEVIVKDTLYVKGDRVINVDTSEVYNLYEIRNMAKKQHYNRGSTLRRYTYSLRIETETTTDLLYFDTSINARDCAYLLLSRKIAESNKNYDMDKFSENISDELAYSHDSYEGFILNKDDVKDKSDWLG